MHSFSHVDHRASVLKHLSSVIDLHDHVQKLVFRVHLDGRRNLWPDFTVVFLLMERVLNRYGNEGLIPPFDALLGCLGFQDSLERQVSLHLHRVKRLTVVSAMSLGLKTLRELP